MNNQELIPIVYDHFEVFHMMCLSTSFMSTYNCKEFDNDAHQIIHFIGQAFHLAADIITAFEHCILGDMMNIGLITDYQAISSTELLSHQDKENIDLYEIKGRILEEIAVCEAQNYHLADMRIANQIHAGMKYEYFHHPYNAQFRFWYLNRLMKSGNVDVQRQVGLLYALGIGCKKDAQKAEECFLKCILWGDTLSSVLVTWLYKITKKKVSPLDQLHFCTDPSKLKGTKVQEYWNLMKLLQFHIIAPKKDPLILNELADLLISNILSYPEKVDLISNFNEKTWHNIPILGNKAGNSIGFRVNKHE